MGLNVLVSCQISKGGCNASILYEVPEEGRDQEPKVDNNEEWAPSNSGQLPKLQHQGISNRQVIGSLCSVPHLKRYR